MQDDMEKFIGDRNAQSLFRVVMGGKSDPEPAPERTWRDRLREAVEQAEAKGDSRRQISIRAGRAEGYVWSLVEDGSTIDPPTSNLVSVALALGLSPAQLFEDGPRGLDPELNRVFQVYLDLAADQKPQAMWFLEQLLAARPK